MTYPPQPGQPYPGQQPDPRGQGGYPPQYPPMYPQQPPQYPQQPQYSGQQQYPPRQQYPDFAPQEPKKRRTGLWAGILVVIVALIAFAVTAFLTPGFLLGAESPKSETVARQLVDALGKKDAVTLNSLKCATTGPDVGRAVDEIGKVKGATLNGPPVKVNDTEDSAVISVTTAGKPAPYTVTFASQDGKWCWKDIARGSAP